MASINRNAENRPPVKPEPDHVFSTPEAATHTEPVTTGVVTVSVPRRRNDDNIESKVYVKKEPVKQGCDITIWCGTGSRVKGTFPKITVAKGITKWFDHEHEDKCTWFLKAECKKPSREFWHETTIPHRNCYDFVFGSKKYIRKENRILIGRLDQWGKQTLRVIDDFEKDGRYDCSCFKEQKDFVMDNIPKMLVEVSEWDYCTIDILKREVVFRCFESCSTAEAAELLFMMAGSKTFELLVSTNSKFKTFDVLTRFDFDYYRDYAFGKKDKDRAKWKEHMGPKKRKKDESSDSDSSNLEE